MRIKCSFERIRSAPLSHNGLLTFTRNFLPPSLINKELFNSDFLCFEIKFENEQCFIKHNHAWKNVKEKSGFDVSNFYMTFTTHTTDMEKKTTVVNDCVLVQNTEYEKVDKLAFLYKTSHDASALSDTESTSCVMEAQAYTPLFTSNMPHAQKKKSTANFPNPISFLTHIIKERTNK